MTLDNKLATVPMEKLVALAELQPLTVVKEAKQSTGPFNITRWMEEHFPEAVQKDWRGGLLWELPECPFNNEHTKTGRVIQLPNGALSFGCFHNSCQGKDWHALRALKEPGFTERQQEGQPAQVTSITQPVIVRMSDVAPEDVSWLWKPYIPIGKITLLEGNPGDGKTWLALQLAACISAGHPLFNPRTESVDMVVGPSNILYLSAEDGLADTLRPRLDAQYADAERVYMLTGSRNAEGKLIGVSLGDLAIIEQAVIQTKPVLLVIDPLQAYLGAKVDMHRANETRPILTELSKLAEKYHLAVVCIRHLSKAKAAKAIFRGMGSIDFSAAARSILLVGRDPEEAGRAVIQTKNSLERIGPALGFAIDNGEFYWTGLSQLTAQQVLRDESGGEDRTAVDDAMEFLQEILSEGRMNVVPLFQEAKQQGISSASLRRAKKELGIEAEKHRGLGQDAPWYWRLPTAGGPQDDQVH